MKDNRLFSKACSLAIFCYKRLYGYTILTISIRIKDLLSVQPKQHKDCYSGSDEVQTHAQSKASVFVPRKWGLHIETIGLCL